MVLLWGRKHCCTSADAMVMASVLRWANWIFLLFIARMPFCPRFDVSRCSCCGGRYLLLVEFHRHTGARQFTARCKSQYGTHKHRHLEFMFGIHIDGRTKRKRIFVPEFVAPNDSIEFNYSHFANNRKRTPKDLSVLFVWLTKCNDINPDQVWVSLMPPSKPQMDKKNII